MECAYVVCPVCWDKLIQVTSEEEYVSYRKDKKCSKCGTHFGLAIHGKKIEDNKYQIILKKGINSDDISLKSLRKALKKVHLDVDNIMRSICVQNEGKVIYEGDTFQLYLFLKAFIGYETYVKFDTIPRFSYKIYEPDVLICPECKADVVDHQEPCEELRGWFLDGFFCEHCNKWTLGPTAIRDVTTYNLVFSYKKLENMDDSSIKREIMNCLKKLPNKEIQGDQMIIHTNSEKIIEIVPYIQSAGCAYDIEPPFPHKID